MLTILDDSLPAELEAGGPHSEAVLTALTICAQQIREGNHILFAERAVYRRLRAFHNRLDTRSAATLTRAEERLPQLGQVRDFAKRAIRIVASRQPDTPSRVRNDERIEIFLPVTAIENQSSLLSLPLLMVENLNDGKCYVKLAQSIVNSGKWPELNWLRTVPLRYEINPGGGNTLSNLFAHRKADANRTGAAIADSDHRYPGSAYGETAAALVTQAEADPVSSLFEHYIINARTIENYIPRAELRSIAEELDPIQLANFEKIEAQFSMSPHWALLPIKSGVRCFDLGQTSAESKFWTELLGERSCAPEAQCVKKRDCKKYATHPLSDQILARSVTRPGFFTITERCMDGVADSWRILVVLLYSLFCGSERVTVF